MNKKTATFEEALERLEEIVTQLESGDCPLEESMKLYEEGVALSGLCNKKLEKARQKIVTLQQAEEEADGQDE
ncbi:MAG TPA: exodeoxyribonuclease VII small subunit [Firmicutes bacterium]|nr:exodeoxyribonuclease VII small subunit [Bacillota bacterium]